MRITNQMMTNNFLINLNKNLSTLSDIQYKMASGKKIRYPSDDPVATARSLRLKSDVAEIEQLKKNVDDAVSWVDMTETALADIGDVLQRVRELVVKASNGTNTTEDVSQIAKEIQQIKEHIIQVGNTNYAGRYIFSGFKTNTAPIQDDGTFSDTNGFKVDLATGKNVIEYEVMKGNFIRVNKTASEIFETSSGSNLFTVLDNLVNDMNNGKLSNINGYLDDLDGHINNINAQRGDVGALQNRLELIQNRLTDDNQNIAELLSKNEDVDIAEMIMKLKENENVYRTALQVGARILPPTLLDFMS